MFQDYFDKQNARKAAGMKAQAYEEYLSEVVAKKKEARALSHVKTIETQLWLLKNKSFLSSAMNDIEKQTMIHDLQQVIDFLVDLTEHK